MKSFNFSLPAKVEHKSLVLDLCRCSVCHVDFAVSDCIKDYGYHDGWEMPAYTELLCPDCECGGCIEDFWSSDEAVLKHGEYLQEHKPVEFDHFRKCFHDVYKVKE